MAILNEEIAGEKGKLTTGDTATPTLKRDLAHAIRQLQDV